MDLMDWLENEELLRFFHCRKTELSCMENPHTFLRQLRDHDLVPEDRYKTLSRMKSKDNIRKGLYELMDWLERERSKRIREFWSCVFKDTILNQYPTLKLLRNSLLDGSFHFDKQPPETVETEESDEGKRKKLSEGEEGKEKKENSVKKKRKLRSHAVSDDEEELAGPSSQLTPRKKSKKKIWFLSDKEDDTEEEEEVDSDLDEEGRFSSSSKESSITFTDEEVNQPTEPQPEVSREGGRKVFRVTCGAAAGTLHKKRFASGTCGKSIRTETSWMTPVEFLKAAACPAIALWKKDIEWEGKPLNSLIEANILRIHSLLCNCTLCEPDGTDVVDQKNDDECCVCRREDENELVLCDHCPRSFHQKCHLPHVDDSILGDDRPWMCTFCIFRTNQEYFYREELEREATMTLKISQRMLQCQYLLLCLCTADEEPIFAADPRLYLNDYSGVIKTPMWLGHIADQLQEQLYQTVGEFVADVQLIFSNCALYNRDNAEILTTGNRLKELFDREFKSVFNINE